MRFPGRTHPAFIAFLLLVIHGTVLPPDDAAHTFVTGLELRQQQPPARCAPALSARLAPLCLVVRSYAEDVARLWWVKKVDPAIDPPSADKVAFPRIRSGALLGVLEVTTLWYDDLDQPVGRGVYTLRYLRAPADALHTSLLRWTDTLLLVPVADDGSPDRAWDPLALQAAATDSTVGPHPRSMALVPTPMRKGPRRQDPPKLWANERGQVLLAFWLDHLPLSVVVSGSALPSSHQ